MKVDDQVTFLTFDNEIFINCIMFYHTENKQI